jgi:transposase InsO family protein
MYRLSPKEKAEMESQVKQLLKEGKIEPSSSPYGAPILFVSKKDGSMRMVIDYRALNKITVKNRYPLPRIDDLLDTLAGAKVFSSLDLTSGYHQIRIEPEDVPKTAFRTPLGHFQWKVLSFGLTNAPATFQSVMNHVFRPYLGKFVLVYMDDILVFSATPKEHEQHLRAVLELLREHQLYVKRSKCSFNQPELGFLGHIVGQSGLQVDPKKVQSVLQWPEPKNVSDVRKFLGLTNYFRKFLQGYSNMVRPLTQLTRGSSPWQWTSAEQAAFDTAKRALSSAPVLRMPCFTLPFEVVCDASGTGLGAVLLQGGHPVAYESHKLSEADVKKSPYERELLAVEHALRVWRCYLEGTDFTVVTDHNPLRFFRDQQSLSPKQARISEFLERFNFTWVYRPGRVNVADPLSRHPQLMVLTRGQQQAHVGPGAQSGSKPAPVGAAVGGGSKRRRVEWPEPSPPPAHPVRYPPPPPEPSQNSSLLAEISEAYEADPWFEDQDNLAGLKWESNVWKRGTAVVVPNDASLRRQCLGLVHDDPSSGHTGVTKMLKHISRLFWWPRQAQHVADYVKSCPQCQVNKSSTQRPAGLLQPLPIPSRSWDSVTMDFIVQLPCSQSGFDAITVYVDRLTKMVHLRPCSTKDTAEKAALNLLDSVVKLHGVPKQIISDRDSKFTSAFWAELLRLMGSRRSLSTAFHPQTDGQTERANRVLESMLRNFVNAEQDDWDRALPMAEFAMNNSWNETVQETPFFLNYGQHPNTMASILVGSNVPRAAGFVQAIQRQIKSAKQLMQSAQQRQKSYADRKRRELEFAVGDEVLLSTKNLRLKTPGCRKLMPLWVGPFAVLEKVGAVAYRLELPEALTVHPVFHVSLLKPFHPDAEGRAPLPPAPLDTEDGLYYAVRAVLNHREVKRGSKQVKGRGKVPTYRTEYLIDWEGYGVDQRSWLPEHAVTEFALREYWKNRQDAPLQYQS